MAYNKIVFGNETLIDLTADTVTEETLAFGVTAHDKAGNSITGTSKKDVVSTDADVTVDEILFGKTAYARGAKLTGAMPNIGGEGGGTIATKDGSCNIARGFHDGSSSVTIDKTEKDKLTATNIKAGVIILGVEGTYGGEAVSAQSRSVTPSREQQTILPEEGYDYLSQVTVAAIPYATAPNSAGGTTVTIG